MKDGTWLKCEDLARFAESLDGPCVFGAKGDVLMYVTHQKGAEDDDFEECPDVTNEDWGEEITYIPADEIVRIDYRRSRR